ncbi:MAG TPA: hypothetical protein VIS99_07710 [Terrimicrobiaceae bacterium]
MESSRKINVVFSAAWTARQAADVVFAGKAINLWRYSCFEEMTTFALSPRRLQWPSDRAFARRKIRRVSLSSVEDFTLAGNNLKAK